MGEIINIGDNDITLPSGKIIKPQNKFNDQEYGIKKIRIDSDLTRALSKHVHDLCKDVPHDIGLTLALIINEHCI